MHRKVLGVLLVLGALSACTQPLRVCETDGDCPGGGTCDVERHLCFGGTELLGACEPACAAYQACGPSRTCVARYTELVVTPGDGGVVGGGAVPVQAELRVGSGFAENFPETLSFSVVRSDGGTASELGPVTRNGGVYTTQWTPPGEGEFLLTAAYPASGGPSTTVRLTVDTTPPSFAVVVPAAEAGVADGGTTYVDPSPGFATAWRRDQVVPVEVRTNEPNLDPSTVMVALQGTDGGSAPAVAVTPVTGACDAGFCGTAELKLWEPAFDAFRGALPIVVQGRDKVGNASNAPVASVNVTRWKWSFNGGAGAIRASPAIGQLGTVYFGTSDSNGKVFALTPEGTKSWEAQLGAVQGSPAVGAYSGGTERVFVGANNSSGAGVLYVLGANGSIAGRCPGAGIESGSISAAVAILNTKFDVESAPIETAVALGNGDALLALRPGATGSRLCITSPLSGTGQQGASIIARGADVYFGAQDTDAKVQGYRFTGTGWAIKPGFTAPAIGTVVTGLGFSGERIVGAAGLPVTGSGGVFSFSEADGSDLQKNPSSFTGAQPVRNMSIGPGNVLFYGREATGGDLTAIDLLATQPRATAPSAGSFVGAPALGASSMLYTAAASGPTPGIGEVSAWSADTLNLRWTLNDSVGRSEASPALDCSRGSDGTANSAPHGVLYVPSIDGKLYAFVVDSRGLDGSAPWPKYQHDSRNTGNPDTPLSSCP